jgi:hypothetical protein
MSSFLNISVLVLATMVLVLAGMLGYLYWQQNKLMKALSSLHVYVQTLQQPLILTHEEEPESEDESEDEDEDESEVEVETKVETEVETKVEEVQEINLEAEPVPAQPEVVTEDIDDLQSKTAVQLRELLNKKGIPYGKRDSKTVLLELLKASS